MFDTIEKQRRITRLAWLSAFATLFVGQLHALARFRTDDGISDLELPLTAFWAEPAGRALDPLLTWASPDTVYLTYGKWWIIPLGVMVLAGAMVMRLRAPTGAERWGWRLFLVGYTLLALGAGTFYWGQWTSYNGLDDIGLWLSAPGALLGSVGATVLGVSLLRQRVKPRLAAVLLLLAIPWVFTISQVTSLGNTDLPIIFAIAMLAAAETRRAPNATQGVAVTTRPAGSRVRVGDE